MKDFLKIGGVVLATLAAAETVRWAINKNKKVKKDIDKAVDESVKVKTKATETKEDQTADQEPETEELANHFQAAATVEGMLMENPETVDLSKLSQIPVFSGESVKEWLEKHGFDTTLTNPEEVRVAIEEYSNKYITTAKH